MKKTIYLTSLLALTACATGGGSGPSERNPIPRDADIGMAHQLLCNENSGICIPINKEGQLQESRTATISKTMSRESTTKMKPSPFEGEYSSDNGWGVLDSDNINMNIIFSPGKLSNQTFVVNSAGDITGLKWSGGEVSENDIPNVMLNVMEYLGNNTFSLDSSNSSGTMEYISYYAESEKGNPKQSKENEDKLNFSNFGVMRIKNFYSGGEYLGNADIPFAGGFEKAKQIPGEKGLQNKTITYTGKSQGMVEYAYDKNKPSEFLNISDDNATLVLDTTDGIKETFTANYVKTDDPSEQWHSLTVSKTNGAGTTYTFSGTPTTDSKFTMRNGGNNPEAENKMAKIFETGYYNGNQGQPGEAVGLINYQEQIDTQTESIRGNNRTMTVGFGMKAEQ